MTTAVRDSRPFLEIVRSSGGQAVIEDANREYVIAAAGKYHQLTDQAVANLPDASDFLRFDDPAYQKLAQSIRVVANGQGQDRWIAFEHRTHALSEQSRRQFGRYWLVINPMSYWLVGMLLAAIKRRAEA
jgi:hypothetical protein